MYIKIREKNSNAIIEGEILPVLTKEFPLKKDGWIFNWKSLTKQKRKLECYKIVLKEDPNIIQAIAIFSVTNYGLLYMEQVEASPKNKGRNGIYDVVGALIAFGCRLSFSIDEPYKGYLGFTSKTNLISFYQKKYKAKLIGNQNMFIEPSDGLKLISYYLLGE